MNSTKNPRDSKRSASVSHSKLKMHTKIGEGTGIIAEKLQPHQDELQHLSELAGIHMDLKVFRILVELLNMGVDPNTIFLVLKNIRRSPTKHSRPSSSRVSH